jgi:probable HAF family extracellular repeat protein
MTDAILPMRERVMLRALSCTLVAALCTAVAASANAAGSPPTVIPSQGGILGPQTHGISGNGQVVIGSDLFNNGWYWSAIGGMVELGGLPGAASDATSVRDASFDGSVIVGAALSDTGWKPVRWTSGEGWVTLGELASGATGGADAVSSDGTLAVGSSDGFPFRWTSGGGMVALSGLSDVSDNVWDLSADGNVAVGHDWPSGEAYQWTSPGTVELLGVLPGDDASTAWAVSANGSTVAGTSSSGSGNRIFRWTQGTGMTNLGTLPGQTECRPTAVSGDGSIVAGFCYSGQASFVWTAATGLIDAKDYFEAKGVDVSGNLTFASLEAMSSNGRVFAGYEDVPSAGGYVSWVVVVPEPLPALSPFGSLALIFILALAGLAVRR